jgi:hypothetical protein
MRSASVIAERHELLLYDHIHDAWREAADVLDRFQHNPFWRLLTEQCRVRRVLGMTHRANAAGPSS